MPEPAEVAALMRLRQAWQVVERDACAEATSRAPRDNPATTR
jgi:hypothetical protein